MEEEELVRNLHGMFERAVPILKNIKGAFSTQNEVALGEAEKNFIEIFESAFPMSEAIISSKEKNDVEKKFASLLIPLQKIGSAVLLITARRKKTVSAGLFFTDKAISEVEGLFSLLEEQFIDTKDFIITKNRFLKSKIKDLSVQMSHAVYEAAVQHENRLSIGLSSSRSSYYYLDILGSFKNISQSLVELSEKL